MLLLDTTASGLAEASSSSLQQQQQQQEEEEEEDHKLHSRPRWIAIAGDDYVEGDDLLADAFLILFEHGHDFLTFSELGRMEGLCRSTISIAAGCDLWKRPFSDVVKCLQKNEVLRTILTPNRSINNALVDYDPDNDPLAWSFRSRLYTLNKPLLEKYFLQPGKQIIEVQGYKRALGCVVGRSCAVCGKLAHLGHPFLLLRICTKCCDCYRKGMISLPCLRLLLSNFHIDFDKQDWDNLTRLEGSNGSRSVEFLYVGEIEQVLSRKGSHGDIGFGIGYHFVLPEHVSIGVFHSPQEALSLACTRQHYPNTTLPILPDVETPFMSDCIKCEVCRRGITCSPLLMMMHERLDHGKCLMGTRTLTNFSSKKSLARNVDHNYDLALLFSADKGYSAQYACAERRNLGNGIYLLVCNNLHSFKGGSIKIAVDKYEVLRGNHEHSTCLHICCNFGFGKPPILLFSFGCGNVEKKANFHEADMMHFRRLMEELSLCRVAPEEFLYSLLLHSLPVHHVLQMSDEFAKVKNAHILSPVFSACMKMVRTRWSRNGDKLVALSPPKLRPVSTSGVESVKESVGPSILDLDHTIKRKECLCEEEPKRKPLEPKIINGQKSKVATIPVHWDALPESVLNHPGSLWKSDTIPLLTPEAIKMIEENFAADDDNSSD